jgi:hypothetical protein
VFLPIPVRKESMVLLAKRMGSLSLISDVLVAFTAEHSGGCTCPATTICFPQSGCYHFARLSGLKQPCSIQRDFGNYGTKALKRNFAVVAFNFEAPL